MIIVNVVLFITLSDILYSPMSCFISFLRTLNGIKALIEYDKEVTKVAKEGYHGNTQYYALK